MDTTFAPPPAPPTTAAPTPTPTHRVHHAGHIVAIVIGCLVLFPGLGLIVGGSVTAAAQAFATDDDGYFRFTPDRISSDGVAVAATDLWLDGEGGDDAPRWLLDTVDVDVRLRVNGATPTDDVFVGIARTSDVERYLSGVRYSDVVEMDGHTPRYDEVAGPRVIDAPTASEFWTVSASGSGEQVITWDARGGSWSIVVMNADGSPAVAADVEIGVRSGAVTPIAVVLIVVGGITVIGAIALIVFGARGRRPLTSQQERAARPIAPTP